MFNIDSKSDYGLILLSELSNKKGFMPLSRLVEKTGLPPRFIARIASNLVKHGVLESKEGKVGGYKILKSLEKINLLDFLYIFNKDLEIVKCQNNRFTCGFDKICGHKVFFKKRITEIFIQELKKWTLKDLI